jgi:hypothetical protein
MLFFFINKIVVNKCYNTLFCAFGYLLYLFLLFSYPNHEKFNIIGSAIVRQLKIPLTKDNIVSLSTLLVLMETRPIVDQYKSINFLSGLPMSSILLRLSSRMSIIGLY